MIARLVIASAALAVVAASASNALAQDGMQGAPGTSLTTPDRRSYFDKRLEAPQSAFELTVGTGYTQGFGMLQSGLGMPSVAREGIGVNLGVGYRVATRWSVGLNGEYQELSAQRGTGARGLTGGANLTFHLMPYERIDPIVSLSTGYRFLWETFPGSPTVLYHGFQLARVTVGADVRMSPEVAIGPMVGADLDVFFWQAQSGNNTTISTPTFNTFVFAGLQGRFDAGGTRGRADISAPSIGASGAGRAPGSPTTIGMR